MIKQHPIICLVLAVCVVGMLFLARVTPEQIDACVDSTGWTEARCKMELSR